MYLPKSVKSICIKLLICCVRKFKLSCVISKFQNGGEGGGTKVLMSERDKMASEKPRSY